MTKDRPPKMRYCTRCAYPLSSAVPISLDEFGVCSGCKVHDQRKEIDWDKRMEKLKRLVERYKTDNYFDCIVAVSGGKDSYYITWIVTKLLGLKPLLVNYHGNNYLPEGTENLYNMRRVFNIDLMSIGPSIEIIKKLNKKCFYKMGDMNWHGHCAINTIPMRIAAELKIPLVFWGEHGYTDLGGMYNMSDLVEFTYKYRLEHACRGFEWNDLVDEKIGITEKDLWCFKYPSDELIQGVGVRGIYIGNYVNWDANAHGEKMIKERGFKVRKEPFERTYRNFSNLDDMHENGMHDYLKYIKFGYGRCTDHVCKDIRWGYLTRDEGIELIKKHDPIKSKDLQRWLKYVDMTEEEFDRVADTFRDSKVWWKNENREWVKDNIWDEEQLAYREEMVKKAKEKGIDIRGQKEQKQNPL